jgi:hypothetical protein
MTRRELDQSDRSHNVEAGEAARTIQLSFPPRVLRASRLAESLYECQHRSRRIRPGSLFRLGAEPVSIWRRSRALWHSVKLFSCRPLFLVRCPFVRSSGWLRFFWQRRSFSASFPGALTLRFMGLVSIVVSQRFGGCSWAFNVRTLRLWIDFLVIIFHGPPWFRFW